MTLFGITSTLKLSVFRPKGWGEWGGGGDIKRDESYLLVVYCDDHLKHHRRLRTYIHCLLFILIKTSVFLYSNDLIKISSEQWIYLVHCSFYLSPVNTLLCLTVDEAGGEGGGGGEGRSNKCTRGNSQDFLKWRAVLFSSFFYKN